MADADVGLPQVGTFNRRADPKWIGWQGKRVMENTSYIGLSRQIALGRQLDSAINDIGATLFQNIDDIDGAASSHSQQQHFHRADAQVFSAHSKRAIHDDTVAAARTADEHHTVDPLDRCFHVCAPKSIVTVIFTTEGGPMHL